MTETPTHTIPVKPLLDKAAHLLGEIAALPEKSTPDKYEKRARAIGELYKTATLIETYTANFQTRDTGNMDYDTTRPASPEQERALREELLGYYDRIHGRSDTDGEADGLSREPLSPSDVLLDVAADSADGSTPAG